MKFKNYFMNELRLYSITFCIYHQRFIGKSGSWLVDKKIKKNIFWFDGSIRHQVCVEILKLLNLNYN